MVEVYLKSLNLSRRKEGRIPLPPEVGSLLRCIS